MTMCLTSTWTRHLALPYLYSTLVFKKIPLKFYRQVMHENVIGSSIPGFCPTDHIRSVWITYTDPLLLNILRKCTNLSNLALRELNFRHIVDFISEEDVSDKPDVHLLILNARYADWSHPVHHSPFYRKITHLRAGLIMSYSPRHLDLAHFSRLSHLAVSYHIPGQQPLRNLLRVFDDISSQLTLVVVIMTEFLTDAERRGALKWVFDVRQNTQNVYAVLSQADNLRNEWEEEVRNGLSIWDKAKSFTQSLSLQ